MDQKEFDIQQNDIPEPDSVMVPEPVKGQELLWEYLDAAVDLPALDRERKFINVKPELQRYLSSQETANQIGEIARKASLTGEQRQSLARTIRDLFTGEIAETEFDASLAKALQMELAQMRDIKSGLMGILEMFRKNATRTPMPLAPTRGIEKFQPPAPSTGEPQIGTSELMPSAPRKEGTEAMAKPHEEAVPETPFMLHMERDEAMPFAVPPAPPLSPQPRPSSRRDEAKPVRVKVETPSAKPLPPKEKPTSRVVHYSNLRTPLE